jgi:hypothetical protein
MRGPLGAIIRIFLDKPPCARLGGRARSSAQACKMLWSGQKLAKNSPTSISSSKLPQWNQEILLYDDFLTAGECRILSMQILEEGEKNL